MPKYQLDPEVQKRVDRIVAELPRLSDAQLDAIADVLARIRLRQEQGQ